MSKYPTMMPCICGEFRSYDIVRLDNGVCQATCGRCFRKVKGGTWRAMIVAWNNRPDAPDQKSL